MLSTKDGSLAARFPQRALRWQLRRTLLEFGNRPRLMGIVNVTPDSFSDGGHYHSTSAAVDHALQLVADGADLLDIGGESTRPYSTPVDVAEELRRVLPVIEQVCRATAVPVSIDTSKSIVAQEALDAGAEVINDVTGLTRDPRMIEIALRYQPGVCAMHMQGTPQTMQDDPRYEDPVREIGQYLAQRREALRGAGVQENRICLDPGIGFGKTHQHNLTLLAHCSQFHSLGAPLLCGHSRKGFVAKLLGDQHADRTAATIGASLALARNGIQVLRVHDVRPTREALLMFEAVGGIDGRELRLDGTTSVEK
jgi:dihydropteroate synthase